MLPRQDIGPIQFANSIVPTNIMEAVIICIDNSEWTRNGDYAPNRFQAQADAVNLLAGAKTEANSENTVGIITMSGKSPRVLVTLTTDLGKILNSVQVKDFPECATHCLPDFGYSICTLFGKHCCAINEARNEWAMCRAWRLRVLQT